MPIVPGTDIALALGMINIIMQEKRHDADFLRAHTGAVYLVDDQQQLMRADPQDKDSYLVFDTVTKTLKRHDEAGVVPALLSEELPTNSAFTTVLDAVWEQAKPRTPQKVETETDVPAQTVLRGARLCLYPAGDDYPEYVRGAANGVWHLCRRQPVLPGIDHWQYR